MVVWRQVVADVVNQRTQDIFVVATVALGKCRSLQAVLKTIYREAAKVMTQTIELFDDVISDARLRDLKLDHDVVPILLC